MTQETNYWGNCFCWSATGNGTAVVEIWGAGGSTGRQCCCASSLPGNPGAYSKKTICVQTGDWIRGIAGMACGHRDANSIFFTGTSEGTCITLCTTANGCDCMCAQGGIGGYSICTCNVCQMCCWCLMGFHVSRFPIRCTCNTCCAVTNSNENNFCGIVCNFKGAYDGASGGPGVGAQAYAWGGDVNKTAGFSCLSFYRTHASDAGNYCRNVMHVQTSPGIISEDGAMLTFPHGNCGSMGCASGMSLVGALNALNVAGKHPSMPTIHTACVGCLRTCGCFEMQACMPFMPAGVPGPGTGTSGDVRGTGLRGGPGMVRIKFIGS